MRIVGKRKIDGVLAIVLVIVLWRSDLLISIILGIGYDIVSAVRVEFELTGRMFVGRFVRFFLTSCGQLADCVGCMEKVWDRREE